MTPASRPRFAVNSTPLLARHRKQYEPVSLAVASVVISATTLAWTIYRDLRDDREPADTYLLARRVRVQLAEQHPDTPTQDRNRIIDIVIEETFKHQP